MRRTVWQVGLSAGLLLWCAVGAFETLWATTVVRPGGPLFGPVALSSAAELNEKLAAVASLPAPTIALVGDSFVHGGSMAPVVGSDWRRWTLDRRLEACLRSALGQPHLSVVNFGLDGLLPLDILAMLPLLREHGADYVLFNLNSRSVSRDFEPEGKRYSRPWLNEAGDAVPAALTQLYARFTLLKRLAFDASPEEWGKRNAARISAWFDHEATEGRSASPDFVTLFKLKARYRTASFEPGNSVQASAVRDLLRDTHVFAFDTVPNRKWMGRVQSPGRRDALQRQLESLIEETGARERVLVSPATLEPDDFVDYLHVLPSGTQKYAEALCPGMTTKLSRAMAEAEAP